MKVQRILTPIDYSPCSRGSLRWAAQLAEKLGAELDVVHVWDRSTYVTDVILTRPQLLAGGSLLELIERNAAQDLRQFLDEQALPAARTGRLLSGDPASALLQELRQGQHQLVVVGTHGRTGLAHALMGSVAEKLARLSPVPVLTIPDQVAQDLRR